MLLCILEHLSIFHLQLNLLPIHWLWHNLSFLTTQAHRLKNMQKFIPTLHVLSKMGLFFALPLLFPAFISFWYQDGVFSIFLNTAAVTELISLFLWYFTKPYQRELRPRDGFALVVMLWVGFAIIAALPFYFFFEQITFTDAFFEAMSGLTTTGATIFNSLDTLQPSLNFWRHMLNWLGGMGIIVLAVAVLPILGVGGTQLFKAEIPGIDKDNKTAPRISQTATHLWQLYLLYTLLTCIALHGVGLGWLHPICHAMAALAMGGFSTHDNSIAYFDSVAVEVVIMLATIIGAINFANHFAAIRHKTLRYYWRDEECRTMLLLLSGSIVVMSLYLFYKGFYSLSDAFRFVSFNYVSIGLASGFANADFGAWPLLTSLWMFFLANILCNTGSTGGGIKLARVLVLTKILLREATMLQHPNAVHRVKVNGRSLSAQATLSIIAFIFAYFITLVLFTFLQLIAGMDFITAFTATISCITNTGPGLGAIGPSHNYALLSDLQKWLCAAVMLLGRLEIFTVLILFTTNYWRK